MPFANNSSGEWNATYVSTFNLEKITIRWGTSISAFLFTLDVIGVINKYEGSYFHLIFFRYVKFLKPERDCRTSRILHFCVTMFGPEPFNWLIYLLLRCRSWNVGVRVSMFYLRILFPLQLKYFEKWSTSIVADIIITFNFASPAFNILRRFSRVHTRYGAIVIRFRDKRYGMRHRTYRTMNRCLVLCHIPSVSIATHFIYRRFVT